MEVKGAEAGLKSTSEATNSNSRNSKLKMIIIKAGLLVGGTQKSAKCSANNTKTNSTIRSTTRVKPTIMTRKVQILPAKEKRVMLLKLKIKALQRIS